MVLGYIILIDVISPNRPNLSKVGQNAVWPGYIMFSMFLIPNLGSMLSGKHLFRPFSGQRPDVQIVCVVPLA